MMEKLLLDQNFEQILHRLDTFDVKMDKLAETITKLVVVEERIINQGQRMSNIESRMGVVETKVDDMREEVSGFKNKVLGGAAVLGFLYAIVEVGMKVFK